MSLTVLGLFLCINILPIGLTLDRENQNLMITEAKQVLYCAPKNCSSNKIGVRLIDFTNLYNQESNRGLVDLAIPHFSSSLFMCFPQSPEELKRVYMMSHVACRQMGYMTFSKLGAKKLPGKTWEEGSGHKDPVHRSLQPASCTCAGFEQSLSSCSWGEIQLAECDRLLELTCGACQKSVRYRAKENSSRTFQSPGFPLAYAYDVWCEWQVAVPHTHTILLDFHQADVLPVAASPDCRPHKPHIEVTYGPQDEYKIRKFCKKSHVRELIIPYRKAKIRFFSGLYSSKMKRHQEKSQGLSISYEAVPIPPAESSSPTVVVLTSLFIVLIVGSAIFYYYRRKQKQRRLQHSALGPNMPGRDQLQKAYDFQRRLLQDKQNIQVRYRNSQPDTLNVSVPLSNITCTFPKAPRRVPSACTTPRSVFAGVQQEDPRYLAVSRLKTNLMDRFSTRSSSTSSVFLPAAPSFQIYRSLTCSDPDDEPLQQEVSKETII